MSTVSNSIEDRLAKIEQTQEWQRVKFKKNLWDQEIALLQGKETEVVRDVSLAGGKIIIKLGGKKVASQIGKKISVKVAEQVSEQAKKIIPGVSLVAGVGLCIFRIKKGYESGNRCEYFKAFLEIVSGGLACASGFGTIGSVGVDCIIVALDLYTDFHPKDNSLDYCYTTLNITETNPSKETVDRAYRNTAAQLHPDKAPLGKQEEFTALMQYINTCKETIYQRRGWSLDVSSEGVE